MINLLEILREKWMVILGKKSLDRLVNFVYGYIYCIYEREGVHIPFLSGFQEYIQNYYMINTDHHWSRIIEFFSNTEEEAFDEFYRLLDKFIKK